MTDIMNLGTVVLILIAFIGLLIVIAPLAIWGHTAKTARLLEQQNELLRLIAQRRDQ